jgi:hypothetical protein
MIVAIQGLQKKRSKMHLKQSGKIIRLVRHQDTKIQRVGEATLRVGFVDGSVGNVVGNDGINVVGKHHEPI